MAWHIAKVGVTTSGGTSWHLAKVSVRAGGSWHIAKVGVAIAQQVLGWHLAKVKVAIPSGWHLAKVRVQATQVAIPVLAAIPDTAVDPTQPVIVTAQVTNGVVPDSYAFSSPGITFSVLGNQASFVPPGTSTGGTVAVTITATKGANTSTPVVANYIVSPDPGYYKASGGTQRAVSFPYYSR